MPKNSTGTTYHICATLPATFNQAGFEALSFTKVGRVGGIEGDVGRTYQTSSFTDLETGAVFTDKGSYDPGAITIPVAIKDDDSGQQIAKAAVPSRNNYAHKIVQRDGKVKYFIGLVLGFPTSFNDANSTTQGSVSIKINPDDAGNDFVEV
jgi:hypothetical protein